MSMKEDHSSSPGQADRHRPAHFKQTPTPAPLPQNYSEFLAQFPLLDVLAGAFYKRLAPSGGLRYVEDAVMAGAGALATDWPRISDGRSLAQVLSYAIKAGVNDIRHFRCHEGRTCSMNDSHERPDATIVDFTTEDFDLLVLDLGLPRMDGLDVLARLRARRDAVNRALPVLILSAMVRTRQTIVLTVSLGFGRAPA